MKKLSIFAILFSLLFLASCRMGGEKRIEKIYSKVVKELALNEAQIAKLDDLKKTLIEEHKKKKANKGKKVKRFDLFVEEFKSDDFDSTVFKKAMEERHKVKVAKVEVVTKKIEAFHETLSPEQREKLTTLMKKVKSKMKEKRGKRK